MMTLTYLESAETEDAIERRRERRVDHLRCVRVFEPSAARSYEGRTCDVSAAGMRLRLPADMELRVGRFLTLSAGPAIGQRINDPLRRSLPARVVWVRRDETDESTVLVGVELYGAVVAAAA